MLVLGPDRYRHQRAQLEARELDSTAPQPAAQGAADDREHDVVDGAAEDVLDPLEVVQLGPRPGEPPVRSDLDVQWAAPGPDWPGSRRPRRAPRPPRRPSRPCARGRCAARIARRASLKGVSAAPTSPRAAVRRRRRRPRHPVAVRLDRLRHGLDVEEHRGDVDARDSVDERVMRLRDQREAVRSGPGPARSPRAASTDRGPARRGGRRCCGAAPPIPGAGSAE